MDHGKSTLTDSLLAKAGLINEKEAGDKRQMDTRPDEQKRGITIKSTGVSLLYDYENYEDKPDKYLINLIDSPGHVDFSSEVTAALRVTDGALTVVDYVEGVCVQTETVLRQALQEMIKPVVMINKVDRAFFEMNHDSESIYQNFVRIIENTNVIISTYQKDDLMGDCQVDAEKGTVCFGSAIHNWGFSIRTFARIYSEKFHIPLEKMISRLWGDNYYDGKKWVTEKTDEQNENEFQRGFCQFVLDPLVKILKALKRGNKDLFIPLLEKMKIELTEAEQELKGKDLIRKVMAKWINVADALIEMIIIHLPSPRQAQHYRIQYLYEGPMDDECAKAMMQCNPNGPTMMFVSKMVPTDNMRFLAFGRVFSGKITSGEKVSILGPHYVKGKSEDLYEKGIQKVVVMMGKKEEDLIDVPCGNICAIVGIDQCIVKQGTITNSLQASLIKMMKFTVSPVVQVAVRAKQPELQPKLINGLNQLAKADPLVQILTKESETIVAGCGELHLEICLNDLVNDYAKIEIIKSDPIVPYKETVTVLSSQVCCSKSPNKHNLLFGNCEPLCDKLVDDIEQGRFKSNEDIKIISRKLIDQYEWDQHDAKKLWVFGPDSMGPNALVDQTKAVQYLTEIRDHMESAFQYVTQEGILAEESMRGIRFNLLDVQLHPDSIHRGAAQIFPTSRQVYYASQLCASPKFQEPIYLVDIAIPSSVISGVYQCLSQRRGVIFEENSVQGTPLLNLKAYLPVSESFGFTQHLRSLTSGQAFPQCVFSHWELINQDPLDVKTKAYELLMNIRKRKGLKLELPVLANYLSK